MYIDQEESPGLYFCSILVIHNTRPHDTTMVGDAFDNFCPKIFETNLNFS